MGPQELEALYAQLDALIDEAREIQTKVAAALAENRRRDEQRVTPESRTVQRVKAHNDPSL